MKHEITTLNTKRALAEALKSKMIQKPLSKITVSELIVACGVNRKTFYYHFEDIYALLKWILEQEAVTVVAQFDLMVNLEDAISFALDYVESNQHILACAYDSLGREELKRFLAKDFYKISGEYIDNVEKAEDIVIKPDFKLFLVHMYTEALAGMLIDIINGKQQFDRETGLKYATMIVETSLPVVLHEASERI